VGSPAGGTTFTVAVDCNDGSGHDRTLTFDSSGALTGGGPLPITGIPAGTQCSVTETGTGGASSVTYSPGGANPPTVTIAANQQSSVTVTNTYNAPETGSLQVQQPAADAGDGHAQLGAERDDGHHAAVHRDQLVPGRRDCRQRVGHEGGHR